MISAWAIQARVLALVLCVIIFYPLFLSLYTSINYYLYATTIIVLAVLYDGKSFRLLFAYLFQDGFCYLEFSSHCSTAFPTVADLVNSGTDFLVFETGPGVWHVAHSPAEIARAELLSEVPLDDVVGGDYARFVEMTAREVSRIGKSSSSRGKQFSHMIPTRDAGMSEGNRMINEIALEVARVLPSVSVGPLARQRPIAGDDDGANGHHGLATMNVVSAMEASRVLLSGMDSLGPLDTRAQVALDMFTHGIPTAVPPADPRFQRMVSLLGPLKFTPRVGEHKVAATFRRAALNHATHVLQGAIVGLVSPSFRELHAFPRAAVWLYTDALDTARRGKHCSVCRAPECVKLTEARAAGRVYDGSNRSAAATLFRKCGVSSLLLINVEPNMDSQSLTALLVESAVYNALSMVSVDWRVLLGKRVKDQLIDMSTELSAGLVVSSFEDGGDYVQSLASVRQMFRPTYARGHALRRTVIFGDGATQYFEVTLAKGGLATRCVPQHDTYYFIKLLMPDMTRPVVLVERSGFDRVLATYRTQAIKNEDVARIVLRQSNVTYSISGTQVTPRIRLTATEVEALAVWVVVYSELQDSMAAKHAATLRPNSTVTIGKSVISGAMTRLATNNTMSMALGAASSVDAVLTAYRRDMTEGTLDEMSQRTLEEHFGVKLDLLSAQNILVQRWQRYCGWVTSPTRWYKQLCTAGADAWTVGFNLADAVAVTCLLGTQFSITAMRAACDCVITYARLTGKLEAARHIESMVMRWSWSTDKATRFWVAVQDAQNLDPQAAIIDIVETYFNLFSADHAKEIQEVSEKGLIDAAALEELAANDALPFSDFLSEIKLFLGKFNSHARRLVVASSLLHTFDNDCRFASTSQRHKMIHVLKEEAKTQAPPADMQEMEFALGGKPELIPIPIKPIDQQLVRESLKGGSLTLQGANGEYKLQMLKKVGSEYDMSPIHKEMEMQHPGGVVDVNRLAGPNILSPDAKGAALQEALVSAVVNATGGVRIANAAAVTTWYAMQIASPSIPYVEKVLKQSAPLFNGEMSANWIAHITGLAFGGKSKGIRGWITSNDVVVVPTADLKAEWQANLGKLDPVARATVVTQHEALIVKYAARYVFIDECYAFDPEHLQAIANRHVRSKGIITIGDRRQIPNVFSPTNVKLMTTECPCVMITPTTFMPADAAAIFLNTTTSDVVVETYYCGSTEFEGLCYTLKADDTLLPGAGDIMIQGTQVGKEMMITRGGPCASVHEAQGRRSQHTIMHFVGRTMTGDLHWLSLPDQAAHLGVAISRAQRKTVMVVNALRDLRPLTWVDDNVVNGALPTEAMYGGTSWDMVEPRTQSDATWVHVYQPRMKESHLDEVALTDPITIGTIFGPDGEAISASEIRTNVELVDGVSFRDEGIACSDEFDSYTTQPRDHPGADLQQALTRAGPKLLPTASDYDNSEHIINLIFEEYIDKKKFFAHLANSKRATINRLTRQQVLDGCYANMESAASCLSFAFLKPEFAKKPSELGLGEAEIKAQGVVTASAMQQAIFSDACDALTHAWARAQQEGKMSPVGLHEEEIEGFISTFQSSCELDIEKQDSSHKPVHILVAQKFLEMASDKMGLGQLATEIRLERKVRVMAQPFKFVLSSSLASGDPWTLIINKIMAVSSLISVAKLKDVRIAQSGDDVTLDRVPEWRFTGINDQVMANKGVKWKYEERKLREQGVTFISRAALPNQTFVYKALRTILKYAYRKRNSIQHRGIQADSERILKISAINGLQAYAEARAHCFGGCSLVIFDMWTRALAVARMAFDSLPAKLKTEEPHHFTVRERNGGCFGYALGCCVESNVAAINAVALYKGPVSQSTGIKACRDNKVDYLVMNEKWAVRSRSRLLEMMTRRKFHRSFVVIYEDHAVAVVPNTITIHSAAGKKTIKWKDTTSMDIVIKDFD